MAAPSSHNLIAYLTDSFGKSYYVDRNNNVQLASLPTRLKYLPDGWAEIQLKWGRNSTYLGIDRTTTDTYKFTKEGATIVRYLMYNNRGLFSKLYFLLYAINPITGIYEIFGRPLKVDLLQMSDEDTGVNVKMIEGGAASYIKANGDTVYAIDFDDDQVLLDGIVLQDIFSYTVPPQADLNANPLDSNDYYQTIEMAFVNNEGENVGIEKGEQSPEHITTDAYYTDSNNYPFKSANPVTIHIAGALSALLTIPTTFTDFFNPQTFQLYIKTATQSILLYEKIIDVIDNPTYQTQAYRETISLSIDMNVTLAADEKIFFVARSYTPGTDIPRYYLHFNMQQTDIKFSFDSRNVSSVASIISGLSLFQKLIDKVTVNRYKVSSTLLQLLAGWYFTSGDAVRQLPNAQIKISLSSFFKFWFAWGAAMGVDADTQVIWLEDQTYTFDNTKEIVNVGEVSDLKVTADAERIFNNIKTGFTDQTYDANQGRYEVNSEQEYSEPDIETAKSLDLIVKDIRADAYGLEYYRAELFSKDTTDNSSDNNVWVLDVVPTGFAPNYVTFGDDRTIKFNYGTIPPQLQIVGAKFSVFQSGLNDGAFVVIAINSIDTITVDGDTVAQVDFITIQYGIKLLNRPPYSPMTGVPPSYYNAAFTPHRSLMAAQQYYAGGFLNLNDSVIKFENGKKNTNVVIGAIKENSNVLVNSLTSYFRPFFFEFTTALPVDIYKYLNQNGYISFTVNGITLHGFAEDVSVQPTYNKAQTWKLLCSSLTLTSDIEKIHTKGNELNIADVGQYNYKNPLHFVPAGLTYPLQYHFRQMDTEWHMNRIERYNVQPKYYQKWQIDDSILLQIIIRDASIALGVYNCKGQLVYSLTPTIKTNSYIQTPFVLYEVPINFSLFPPGLYTVQLAIGAGDSIKYYLSEPFITAEQWKETILIEAWNSINYNGMVFTTGFRTKVRVEGGLPKYYPRFKRDAYENEPLDIVTTGGRHDGEYDLLLGGDGVGLPDWMLRKVSAIIGELDTKFVDGIQIEPLPDAEFEENTDITGTPMGTYIIKVREAKNINGLILEGDGTLDSPLIVEYHINTRLFSGLDAPNANQQDNNVQITDVE